LVGRSIKVLKLQSLASVVEFPPFEIPIAWFPAGDARAVIVLVPAMGTSASYYRPFAEFCTSRAFSVLLAELPGSGASRPRPSRRVDYGYRDLVSGYLPLLVEQARGRCGNKPLVLLGHSLGGHVGVLATLQAEVVVDALVTLAAGNIHYRNWVNKGAGKVRYFAWLVTALSYLFGQVPGQYLGLGSPQPRTLMREWAAIIRSGSFSHIADALPAAAPMPALAIGFEGDFMAPSKSVASLAHTLRGDMDWLPVTWPGNAHASWARHPEPTLSVIEKWLAARSVVSPQGVAPSETD
jgi:predicted alpha/beta hydrolase